MIITIEREGYLINIQESGEICPVGIIIDIFNAKTEELIKTDTYWYTDLEK